MKRYILTRRFQLAAVATLGCGLVALGVIFANIKGGSGSDAIPPALENTNSVHENIREIISDKSPGTKLAAPKADTEQKSKNIKDSSLATSKNSSSIKKGIGTAHLSPEVIQTNTEVGTIQTVSLGILKPTIQYDVNLSTKINALVIKSKTPTKIKLKMVAKNKELNKVIEIKDFNAQTKEYISHLIQIDSPINVSKLQISTTKQASIKLEIYSNTETKKPSNGIFSNIVNLAAVTQEYNRDTTSGAKYSSLPIIPRVEWGKNPSSWDPHSSKKINDMYRLYYDSEHNCRWLPEYYRAQRIIIHHTVTKNYPNDPYRAVREIYLYHAYSRGWKDIGYNFLIDSEGRIFEGKIGGEGVKAYHAYEAANDMSIGIALIGDFTNALPTSKQLDSLKKLMAEKATLHGFDLKYGKLSLSKWKDPSYTVFGHRDSYRWIWDRNDWEANNTACPGQRFYTSGLLGQITNEAQSYKQTHFDEIKQARAKALDLLNQISSDHIPAIELTFNYPETVDEQTIRDLIPRYSGIKSVRIKGNKAYISVQHNYDNGYCGYIIPPLHWKGYDDCGPNGCMFFPESQGAIDRLKVLLTIFYLNPQIKEIRWYNKGGFH